MKLPQLTYYTKLAVMILPLVLLFTIVFHLDGGKAYLSRTMPISIVVALVFFRSSLEIKRFASKQVPFFICSVVVFCYFSICHLLRVDEFALPRTLLISLLYVALIPWRLFPKHSLSYLFALAGIVAGICAFYQYYILGIARVGVTVNPIPYALYCAAVALLCFTAALRKGATTRLNILLWVGFALALCALLLTSVRGVMLFLPGVLIAVWLMMRGITARQLAKITCAAVLLTGACYTLFQTQIDQRIAVTYDEIAQIQQGNMGTSIGARLMMWQHGQTLMAQNWLVGIGGEATYASIQNTKDLYKSEHLHNQYIDLAAKYGLLGTSILLIWLVAPLFRVSNGRLCFQPTPALVSLCAIFLLAGLSDTPLHHTHLVYFYTVVSGILLVYEPD